VQEFARFHRGQSHVPSPVISGCLGS